jgi:hypothetical protein
MGCPVLADHPRSFEVRQHRHVKELGSGGWREGVIWLKRYRNLLDVVGGMRKRRSLARSGAWPRRSLASP